MVSDCADWQETKDSAGPRINTVVELPLLHLVSVPTIKKKSLLTSRAR